MTDSDGAALSRKIRETPEVAEFLGFLSREISLRRGAPFLMNRVVEELAGLLKAEAASLLLLNEETRRLDFVVVKGLNDQALKELDLHLKPDEGLAGWVFTQNKPAVVNDPGNDPRFKTGVDLLTGFKTRNLLAAPLRRAGKPFGVVEVINRKKREPFTELDAGRLTALSPVLVTVFDNIRLHEAAEAVQTQFRALLENLPHGFVGVDRKGRLTHVNAAALEMIGVSETSLGKELPEVFRQVAALGQALAQVLAEEKALPSMACSWAGKRGEIHFSCSVFPLKTTVHGVLGAGAIILAAK